MSAQTDDRSSIQILPTHSFKRNNTSLFITVTRESRKLLTLRQLSIVALCWSQAASGHRGSRYDA